MSLFENRMKKKKKPKIKNPTTDAYICNIVFRIPCLYRCIEKLFILLYTVNFDSTCTQSIKQMNWFFLSLSLFRLFFIYSSHSHESTCSCSVFSIHNILHWIISIWLFHVVQAWFPMWTCICVSNNNKNLRGWTLYSLSLSLISFFFLFLLNRNDNDGDSKTKKKRTCVIKCWKSIHNANRLWLGVK